MPTIAFTLRFARGGQNYGEAGRWVKPMIRIAQIAIWISTVILFVVSAFSQVNNDDISKKQVVSSNDYKSIMATLSSRKDISTNYVFKNMLYVIGLPGGLMTNEISVQFEDSRNSRRELAAIFSKSNEHWNMAWKFRIYDHISLTGNVPYGAAEVISRALEKSTIYGYGHHVVCIIGSDSDHFDIFTSPPKGTDFVVILEPNSWSNVTHNRRRIFVAVENGVVRFLGKEDSTVIY